MDLKQELLRGLWVNPRPQTVQGAELGVEVQRGR